MKIKNILLLLFLVGLFSSCNESSFENKFDQLPSERVQAAINKYKEALVDAPYGWKMTYSLRQRVEYVSYQIVYFNKNNTVKFHSTDPRLVDPIESEYIIKNDADVEIVFNTFNENLTIFSLPNIKLPKGLGGDIEFNFKSMNEAKNEIVLEGKVYGGVLKLEKAKEEFANFDKLKEYVGYLANERTDRYMNLAITAGLEGATEEKPISIGMDLSSSVRVADYAFQYNGVFKKGLKMLYFTHEGMGLSSPVKIGEREIQFFQYNNEKKRYEVANSEIKGYLYCTQLPVFYVPGVVDEFLDHYSLWMKSASPGSNVHKKYKALKSENKKISTVVFVTDYYRRIPLFNEKGEPIYDKSYNHDYEKGEKLGNGLLFSFEGYNQFYFYFVPLKVIKTNEDRLRFERMKGDICKPKKGEDASAIAKGISESAAFNDFVEYICNKDGWYIKRTVESGQIDWDFISQANPKEDYFYTRLK